MTMLFSSHVKKVESFVILGGRSVYDYVLSPLEKKKIFSWFDIDNRKVIKANNKSVTIAGNTEEFLF